MSSLTNSRSEFEHFKLLITPGVAEDFADMACAKEDFKIHKLAHDLIHSRDSFFQSGAFTLIGLVGIAFPFEKMAITFVFGVTTIFCAANFAHSAKKIYEVSTIIQRSFVAKLK